MSNKETNINHYKLIKEFKKEFPTIKSSVLELFVGDIGLLLDGIEKAVKNSDVLSLRFLLSDLYDLYNTDEIDYLSNLRIIRNKNLHYYNALTLRYYLDAIDEIL